MRLRPALIVLHRWVGLAIAVFLTLAGLTGSLLAFYFDLDAALNPEIFQVAPPTPGAAVLDPITLSERVRAQLPEGTPLQGAELHLPPGRSVNFWVDGRETFVDPYTGSIIASRKFGDLREGKKGLLTFIYRFHYSLALDQVGTWLFGAVALLWTLDCFVGAYLTLPARRTQRAQRSKTWFARWLPAWLLKTNTLFTLVFTWHRASGLWIWGFLLVFAWSGVALNLNDQVYAPLMDAGFGKSISDEPPKLAQPKLAPQLDMRAALARGQQLMAAESQHRDFAIHSERSLYYDPEHGAYAYTVDSSLDVDARLAETMVLLDGDDGRNLLFYSPALTTRSAIDKWLIGLHFAAIRPLGVLYRVFVCVLGVLVALLSVTGVWIWLRKRNKRA